jgi:quercetin dioxygenase-like cupin family protein
LSPLREYSSSFYVKHGFDGLTGPEAEATQAFHGSLSEQRARLPLVGNLYEARVHADFPGNACALPINWLMLPERKFDYVLIRTEPGESFPIHVHGYGEEIYLVIAGEGLVYLGDETHDARVHDIFHIPPGTPHGFRASSEVSTTFDVFVVNSPPVDHRLRSRYWAVPEQTGQEG